MLTIITFASSSVAAALNYSTSIFADLKYLIALVVGLPLAYWVIRKTISLVRAK